MLRKNIFITICMFICIGAIAQSVEYTYDDAGNRNLHHVVTFQNMMGENTSPVNGDTAEAGDSTMNKSAKIKPLTDLAGGIPVRVMPNPVKEALSIQVAESDTSETLSYCLFDMKGILLRKQDKLPAYFNVWMKEYPNGSYILKIFAGRKASEWKIVKTE